MSGGNQNFKFLASLSVWGENLQKSSLLSSLFLSHCIHVFIGCASKSIELELFLFLMDDCLMLLAVDLFPFGLDENALRTIGLRAAM